MTQDFVRMARRYALAALTAYAVLSCGGESTKPIEITIPAAGGTVSLLGGLIKLTVPAGAVATDQVVTAAASSSAPGSALLVDGTAIDLAPASLTFQAPIALSVDVSALTLPNGVNGSELRLMQAVNGAWVPVAGSSYDGATHVVTGNINGFGTYGIVAVSVATLAISPKKPSIEVGATQAMTALMKDAANTTLPNRVVTWSSATPSVASVNIQTGVVTAKAVGSTIITGSAEGISDTTTVTVTTPVGNLVPWLGEDFSTYTSTANLKTNPRGIYTDQFLGDGNESSNTTQIFLDTTVGYPPSSRSMRYDFPTINQSDYTIGVNMHLPTTATEIWVEVAARFSNTFTTLGPAAGNADYKFFSARVNGSGRFMLFNGTYGSGWQWGYPGNDQGANSDVVGYYGNATYPFSLAGNPWDGNWHVYRFHMKVGASGAAEWWYDGTKMPGFANANASVATNIYGLAIGRNMNKGTSHPMSVWWGHIFVYNQNPGW